MKKDNILIEISKMSKNPKMYLGSKNISLLTGYIDGFMKGKRIVQNKFSYSDLEDAEILVKLKNYIRIKTIGEIKAILLNDCLLEATNGDEEKACDLFFKLFYDFIKEEGINING